jgi:hypothetical protein
MSQPQEEAKGQAEQPAPIMMTFDNFTAILDKGLQNMKFSEIDFKKKHKDPSPQVLHDFVT